MSVHELAQAQNDESSRRNTLSDFGGDGLEESVRSSSSARASSSRPKLSRQSTSLDTLHQAEEDDDRRAAAATGFGAHAGYLDDTAVDPRLKVPEVTHIDFAATAGDEDDNYSKTSFMRRGRLSRRGVDDDPSALPPRVANNPDFAHHHSVQGRNGGGGGAGTLGRISGDGYLPQQSTSTATSTSHDFHGLDAHGGGEIDPTLDPYGILPLPTGSTTLRESLARSSSSGIGAHQHDGGLAMLRSQYGNHSAGSPSHHGSTASTSTNNLMARSAISPGQSAANPYGGYFTSPSDAGSIEMMHASRTYPAAAAGSAGSTGGSSNHFVGPTSTTIPLYDLASETLGSIGASRHSATSNSQPFASVSSPMSNMLNPAERSQLMGRAASTHHHNALDTILPRPLLHLIINLFFDYVYPLTPCLHKPTFLRDLMSRREERPGEDEWIALVLATVMSTLVQVPRAFVPLSRREVRDLAAKCYKETRKWTLHGYKEATVSAVVVRYFSAIYNYVRGFVVDCHTSLNEAQALSIVMRLHEEESYHFLNPIEREMRRRIFFLLFGADKSEAVLLGRPIRMREEDCYSLHLPEELDDEYITETRYLPQPLGVTSIITGLNASTRVHCRK